MHNVSINGRHRAVPDSWNTLTRQQLLYVVRVLYSEHRTPMDLRLRLLCVLLDVRLPYLVSWTDVQLAQLVWLTDFIIEGNSLTTQLLPYVQLGLRNQRRLYHGPLERLRNVSFAEFIFADSYFVHYSQERDPVLLNKLVAVLYRPQRPDYRPHAADYAGDRREDFNEHLVTKRAEKLAALPADEKLAILTWYAGCRRFLEQLYPDVFTAGSSDHAKAKGWDYVLREMSGAAFGNVTETSKQMAHMVLAKIQDDQEAAERIRQQQRLTS